uniref:putative nuclease HARBI1 n=1 Tax=Pristiophorus japonicus TaxID=55135 RepID=UPI00398F24A5
MTEQLCQRRLRLLHQVMADICSLLDQTLLSRGPSGHTLPVVVKVTSALNFFAFQGSAADSCRISQSVTHSCITQATNGMFHKSANDVNFATDEASVTERALSFVTLACFPQIQGDINCTSILRRNFGNCKGFHSFNAQLICNHKKIIMHVCARFPGSCHESFVLRQSTRPQHFAPPNILTSWLLGDKGYPLKKWLMTPLRMPSNEAKECYNDSHMSARCVIEQAISIMKMHFRCLDRSGGALQYAPARVS